MKKKKNTGPKALIFRLKIWPKISRSAKNVKTTKYVKTTTFLTHNQKREILSNLIMYITYF